MSSIPASRPEAELLLSCARTSRSPEATDRIRSLIQEGIDWEYLLRTSYRHGVAPLLYWHLDATCPDAVPENAFARLRDRFRATNQRNLFLAGELLRLLGALGAHGIPAVPLKGPALAASVYGNLALREFGDLDVLVRRHHVPKAKEALVSMGYQPQQSRPTQAQEASYLRSLGQHTFTRDDGKIIVELHWEIVPRCYAFSLHTERLWGRLDRILLGGNVVPNPSPEDMLLILCAHGYEHLWGELKWVCDVAEFVRVHQDVGWERVMAQAKALGGERMLLLGLFLANDLLGAMLPEIVRQKVWADPAVKALAESVREQLFREADSPASPSHVPAAVHLEMRERLRDKIRYCACKAVTLTEKDWELTTLPDFLFPLYYVLRPIRLTGKYGARMLERLL